MTNKRLEVTNEKVEELSNILDQMQEKEPPKKKMTGSDVVKKYKPKIKKLISKGFSYSDVKNAFSQAGIELSESTIKSAMQGGKKHRASSKKDLKEPAEQPVHNDESVNNTDGQYSVNMP
ncbi:hypothetical protein [uncultured Methylophaga sp.]|uniref:hypothetical protein n=1 Tax=uncultured Methylophaga sp. TaxID=285271 RepID=UPI00260A3271|nr:hypothetical protein [uncultured Methylophaga sp.]